MNEVEVKGRELKRPRVTVTAGADRVVMRIDDDERPEFWLEVTLPVWVLANWCVLTQTPEFFSPEHIK